MSTCSPISCSKTDFSEQWGQTRNRWFLVGKTQDKDRNDKKENYSVNHHRNRLWWNTPAATTPEPTVPPLPCGAAFPTSYQHLTSTSTCAPAPYPLINPSAHIIYLLLSLCFLPDPLTCLQPSVPCLPVLWPFAWHSYLNTSGTGNMYFKASVDISVLHSELKSLNSRVAVSEWTAERCCKTEPQSGLEFSQSFYKQNHVAAVCLRRWNLRSENKLKQCSK